MTPDERRRFYEASHRRLLRIAVAGSLALPFSLVVLLLTRGSGALTLLDAALVVFASLSITFAWKITWQARLLAGEMAHVVGTNLGVFLLRRRGDEWTATHMPRTRWNLVAALFPARGRGSTVERAVADAARSMGYEIRNVP